MVVGKKAFRGESITGLIFKIITEEPPPMREHEPNVPDELVRIVAKALAKSPDACYQTGHELAADLLALTRAGSAPTLRQSELATTGPHAARDAADVERPADALGRDPDERARRPDPPGASRGAADHADAAAAASSGRPDEARLGAAARASAGHNEASAAASGCSESRRPHAGRGAAP